ncbi:MAG: acetyl-CoA carboxylase biotin carboxyl carrier protein [Chloroflexia bacterium]
MVRLPDKGHDDRPHGDDDAETQAGLPTLAELSQEVKELIRHISTTDVSELNIESGPIRITIKRGFAAAPPAATPAPHAQAGAVYIPTPPMVMPDASKAASMIGQNPTHGEGVMLAEGEQIIAAPMVGTYYSAPSPTSDPYVSEGDSVEPGQTVGIIEAMKMMNPIESEVVGTIVRILVKNAQPVEYGQPLMVVSAT